MKRQQLLVMLALTATLAIPQLANAAMIISDLGNTASSLNDGDKPSVVPDLVGAQGGQPAPFDMGYGTDGLFAGNFMQGWTHNYAPIVDTILSATVRIGIADHDSAASGSQLGLFTLDGNPLTTELDALFEAGGGADTEYNVYSLALPGSIFADLADGSMTAQLNLAGPGLVTPLIPLPGPNPPTETTTNGAFLIFSTLEIETGVVPVPEPGTLLLMSTFGILLGAKPLRRRRGRALVNLSA
jgi:hypothetical protein